jgi:hypothetical protein
MKKAMGSVAKGAGPAGKAVAKSAAMKKAALGGAAGYPGGKMGDGIGKLMKKMDPSSAVTAGEYKAAMRKLKANKDKNAKAIRRGY